MDKRVAAKKSVNVLLDVDLLKQARAENVNLSSALDRAVRLEILQKWRTDTAAAFEENRKRIEKEGLWSDGLRTW